MKEGTKKLSLSHPAVRSVSAGLSRAAISNDYPHDQSREPLRRQNRQLSERVKELTCLCAVSQLKDNPNQTLLDFLIRVLRLIPPGWQYPENMCVRISFRGREFTSENYCESDFRQTADLIVHGEQVGTVEVAYREEKPTCYEGPFLKEERTLLDALAREISTFIRYKQDDLKLQLADSKLREEQQHLKDKNTTLREVLKQIEDEKRHFITQVQTNVDRVVAPILRMLGNKVNPSEQHYLTLLNNSLKDITSPFLSNLESRSRMLSPREGEICNMIRNGMSSKDIAAALDVSLHTVMKQRQRIRKKLGITNNEINLASYLQNV